jgi:hypothetical protein
MFEYLPNTSNSASFLQWWSDNPIIIGGDRFSDTPGMAICYIQHSNAKTFELKLEPVQADRPRFTQSCLGRMLDTIEDKRTLDIQLMCDETTVASAILYVDEQRRWACGDGVWITMKGRPSQWRVDFSAG